MTWRLCRQHDFCGHRLDDARSRRCTRSLAIALIAGERAIGAIVHGEHVNPAELDGLIEALHTMATDARITYPVIADADVERARALRARLASEGTSPAVRALAAAYPLAMTEGPARTV